MRATLLCLTLVVGGCSSAPPIDLWRTTHQFGACPDKPNCVSSVATDEEHKIEPLRYEGDPAAAKARLSAVIASMPGAQIEFEDDRYIHAMFVTRLMRFRDDVELLVRDGGVIEVRSVSRVGYSDFGVNRSRVEDIRRRFEARKGQSALP